jgi:LacI family transcriptional regulator
MSLTEVARLAGVSAATVSRVLNGDPRVRRETAERVATAMVDLDYRPPDATDRRRSDARSRMGRHTGRIALLIPDTNVEALRTPLSGRLLHGMDAPLHEAGLELSLTRLPGPETLPRTLDRRHTDGVIVRAAAHTPAWLAEALRHLPHVWIFETTGADDGADRVVPDNVAVAHVAAEWLLARGRRLGLVLAWREHPEMARRAAEFTAAVRAAGGEVTAATDAEALPTGLDGVFVPESGQLAATHRRVTPRGTALIACTNDAALRTALQPPPACLDIQPEAIGAAAVELLVRRLAQPNAPARRIVQAPRLVE